MIFGNHHLQVEATAHPSARKMGAQTDHRIPTCSRSLKTGGVPLQGQGGWERKYTVNFANFMKKIETLTRCFRDYLISHSLKIPSEE